MKVNGKTIKLRGREFIHMAMGRSMKACGKVINSTDLGRKYGQTVLNIKGIMYKVKSMELVNSNGQTDLYMREIFLTITFTGKVRISGVTGGSTRDSGEKIECIIVEYSNGRMDDNI